MGEFTRRRPEMKRLLCLLLLTAISAQGGDKKSDKKSATKEPPMKQAAARDWSKFPAIAELTTTEDVFALGDVHGGHERLVTLLSAAGLIKANDGAFAWTGGKRVLVVLGDVIDKGSQSLQCIDLLTALEAEAAAAGGRVIVTLGNHEAEFLADPKNKKAKREFDKELSARNLNRDDVASGRGVYGEWLAQRPLAAKVNGWFFAHGGNSGGLSVTALADAYRKAVDASDWGAELLVGKESILESQKWWKAEATVDADLTALGARHIVFGHDPGAFDPPARIGHRFEGKLFRIDVGMSPAIDFSKGALLLIQATKSGEEVSSVDSSGAQVKLWSSKK